MQLLPIDPAYTAELAKRLHEISTKVEQARNVTVLPSTLHFLLAVVVESVSVRSSEWRAKYHIDCSDPNGLTRTIALSLDSVHDVLGNASAVKHEGTDYILITGVIARICAKYCGVFPFCQ